MPPRKYVHVEPTDEPLAPTTVEHQLQRLHGLVTERESDGLRAKYLGPGTEPLAYEILLVSTGGDHPRLDYYVGCSDQQKLDTVDRILGQLFPDGYELTRTELDLASELPTEPAAATHLTGRAERRDDWQTRLVPYDEFHDDREHTTPPLASAAAVLADQPRPAVYQALVRPKADYTKAVTDRRVDLELGTDTPGQWLFDMLFGELFLAGDEPRTTREITRTNRAAPSVANRLDDLDDKDARRTFTVTARAVVFEGDDHDTIDANDPDIVDPDTVDTTDVPDATDPHAITSDLASAFDHVDGEYYAVDAVPADPAETWDAVRDREHAAMGYDRLYTKLPGTTNRSEAIVADPAELPLFTLFGGAALPAATRQAIAPTPTERSALPGPSTDQLDSYRGDGLTLGPPLDGDPTRAPIALPPALQPLHVAVFGATGSGKSTLLARSMLDNATATDGADVLVLPKGDGMATAYLRAHYARHGTLDDVYYFDCGDLLPALSFFDVRAELEAGVTRERAVADRIDHYVEIVKGLMTDEAYADAKRAPDVIRYLLRALFDPVHGADAFSHRDLHRTARRMRDRQSAPAVADTDLEALLSSVVGDRGDTFRAIMQGVLTRVEKIPTDRRLARIFNHVHDGESARFDLADYLDDDVTVILDTGTLAEPAQRALTLVLLSNLWTALRRRRRRREDDDLPLVNCYVEEAATVADTGLLTDLLSQARGFGLSLTLAMQFPAQLRSTSERAYQEVLNNVGTIVTGPVGHDPDLARRLATDDMPSDDVATRLRGLSRGQWLAALPAPFDAPTPRPFLLASPDPPPGHPTSDVALSGAQATVFEEAMGLCARRTSDEAGLPLARSSTTDGVDSPTAATAADDGDRGRVDTALPYTRRLPGHLEYDADRHAIECTRCETRYDPDAAGMAAAVDCCPAGTVDADDVPICEVNLKLSPADRRASAYSDAQLMFLQAVYNAQQRRYDPPAYDLRHDSMLRLREYVGVDAAAVDELLEDGLLRHDGDHPHRLYTVSATGRTAIGEAHRRGVAHGHGRGDLSETSQHTMGVAVLADWVDQEYVADPESPAAVVHSYYEPDHEDEEATGNADRLDVVALDEDGDVVVAGEVERVNNDLAEAAPGDFDKMAACDPEEAIWVVMSQAAGHRVLGALNGTRATTDTAGDDAGSEPDADDERRVDKTYAETTPPQEFRIDEPGFTAMYPVAWLRDRITE